MRVAASDKQQQATKDEQTEKEPKEEEGESSTRVRAPFRKAA